MAQLESLMRRTSSSTRATSILDRAIPDLRDGLKPVQRRILHTLFAMHDGRLPQGGNVIGETMKLHPHGDASIGDALVVLANKDYFIERQGNFGSVLTGPSRRRAPLHRVPPHAARARDPLQRAPHRVRRQLRRAQPRAGLPAREAAGDADARHRGHRGGDGDPHPAPQPGGALGGADRPARGRGRSSCLPDFPQGGLMDVSRRLRRRPRQGRGARARSKVPGTRSTW